MTPDWDRIIPQEWPRPIAEPTVDRADAVWVAADESGTTGENLADPRQPVVSHAIVRIDDIAAAPVVQELRQEIGAHQATELKFARISRKADLLALRQIFAESLAGRFTIQVADKQHVIVSKAIDLLVESRAHDLGIDLYRDDTALKMALTLSQLGPKAIGDQFAPLMAAFASLARAKQRSGAKETVASFFDRLRQARKKCWHSEVGLVLDLLLDTRSHADDLVAAVTLGAHLVPPMDPMAFLLTDQINEAHHRYGPISMLHDENKVLTHAAVRLILQGSWVLHPRKFDSSRPELRDFGVGKSVDHPSIQLADLAAGAGRVVIDAHLGRPTLASEILTEAVAPAIVWGVLPDGADFWRKLQGLPPDSRHAT